MVETAAPPAPLMPRTPGEALEAALPDWQQRLNRFAENWIFAFLVAMAIRHVFLEAFQIPSASMEPMLYGDPRLMKRDFVVVDKFLSRFRTPQRWDVTVFQFPLPELQGSDGRETDDAYSANGKRRDIPFVKPLMYRNFVKRAVILPGDTFYISHGDIFLKQTDGTFAVAPKPTAVRDAMLDEIYRHGAQEESDAKAGRRRPDRPVYLPWGANGGSTVTAVAGTKERAAVTFTLAGGEVAFTQPVSNLYLKGGNAQVQAKAAFGVEAARLVPVAMTAPEFDYELAGVSKRGNLWNLGEWDVWRVTTDDLDNVTAFSTHINRLMNESTGDIRLRFTVDRIAGAPVVRLSEGTTNCTELRLGTQGWSLVSIADGGIETVRERGDGDLSGHAVALVNVDDQVSLTIDGVERPAFAAKPVDPASAAGRLRIAVTGQGALTLSALAIDRDVHYCAYPDSILTRAGPLSSPMHERLRTGIRAQMRYGKSYDDLTTREQAEVDKGSPWANSPATAVTAPAGAYLMLGDNSPHSWDGRSWGWVPAINLRGRVLAVVMWPWRWHVVR